MPARDRSRARGGQEPGQRDGAGLVRFRGTQDDTTADIGKARRTSTRRRSKGTQLLFFIPNVSGRLRDLTGNEEFGGASDVTQPEMKNSAVPAANPKAVKGALRRALSFAAESHAGEQHPKPGEGRYRQALPGPWGSLTKTGPPDWILVK